jgi:molecular chaperone HtpG
MRADHPQAAAAARLLRSVKVILGAQGRAQDDGVASGDLNRAFGGIADAVQQMLQAR